MLARGVRIAGPAAHNFICPVAEGQGNVCPDVGREKPKEQAGHDNCEKYARRSVSELAKGRVVLGRPEIIHGGNVVRIEGAR